LGGYEPTDLGEGKFDDVTASEPVPSSEGRSVGIRPEPDVQLGDRVPEELNVVGFEGHRSRSAGGVERAVEHHGGMIPTEPGKEAEDVSEREPLVDPVAPSVPHLDDVEVAGERVESAALTSLQPQDLGESEGTNPAVADLLAAVSASSATRPASAMAPWDVRPTERM
jgi:hypothetical protein